MSTTHLRCRDLHDVIDPATLDVAHPGDSILDLIEPQEGPEFREAARLLASFVHRMLLELGKDRRLRRTARYIALCRLCGMEGFIGMSLRRLAAECELTHAAVSKAQLELESALRFPTWTRDDLWHKSPELRQKYREVQLKNHWRNRIPDGKEAAS